MSIEGKPFLIGAIVQPHFHFPVCCAQSQDRRVQVEETGGEKTTYANLDTEKAKKIVAEHLQKGRKVDNLAVGREKKKSE